MPLQRTEAEIVRERHGFAFPMRVTGTAQFVQVVVNDDALVATTSAVPEHELKAQLEADLPAFEVSGGREVRSWASDRRRGCLHLRKRRSRFLQLRDGTLADRSASPHYAAQVGGCSLTS